MIRRVFSVMLCLCLIFSVMNVSAFTISYDGKSEEYTGRIVSLFVNGEKIESDMPAIIMNDRTLVPARAVFEKLGAEVAWDEIQKKVTVAFENTDVQLTVNSDTALVNGESKKLDSPAKIINDRTMIPVRFPAEAIGCSVTWNDSDASVNIDMAYGFVNVTGVNSVYENGFVTTTVSLDGEVDGTSHFTLSGNRIVVDIEGAKLNAAYPDKSFENLDVKRIRTGQFRLKPYVLRLVADVESIVDYTVEKNGNSVVFRVRATEKQAEVQKPVVDLSWDNGIKLSDSAKSKLVLIDPGHGGSDVGAVGRDGGVDVLYEKDVNLAVSQYLYGYLSEAGAKLYMMRNDDSTVSLYDRPEIANNIGADLYVSVHSNSFGTDKPFGTTVLYYADGGGNTVGKTLARNIQSEIVATLGTHDRGLTNGSEMYVIRKTAMPSVIVEMAFISNPNDRQILADDNCRRLLAQSIARGIIKTLNEIA